MSRRFRILCAAALAACIASSLVGCSKPKPTSTTTTGGPEQAVTKPAEKTTKPGVTAAKPAEKTTNPAVAANPLAELARRRKAVKSFEISMNMGGQETSQAMKFDNGKPLRAKTAGPRGWILTEFDKNVQYVFNPKSNVAMKMPMNMPKTGTPGATGNPEGSVPTPLNTPNSSQLKAATLKSGTVDGVDCWVYQMAIPSGAKAKVWIDKQYGLMRQIEENGKAMKVKYDKINAVPDSDFELPAGVKVQDMPAMGPGMPGRMPHSMPGR